MMSRTSYIIMARGGNRVGNGLVGGVELRLKYNK